MDKVFQLLGYIIREFFNAFCNCLLWQSNLSIFLSIFVSLRHLANIWRQVLAISSSSEKGFRFLAHKQFRRTLLSSSYFHNFFLNKYIRLLLISSFFLITYSFTIQALISMYLLFLMHTGFSDRLSINKNLFFYCSLNSRLLSLSAFLLLIFFCIVIGNWM